MKFAFCLLIVHLHLIQSAFNSTTETKSSAGEEATEHHFNNKYRHFDEYILSIKYGSNRDMEEIANVVSGKHKLRHQRTEKGPESVDTRRKRPSAKTACCYLGKIAGEQGYHCQASFYQSRIQMRNRNRAQTKQAALEDISREPAHNLELWTAFGQCMQNYAKAFHACCYSARLIDFKPFHRRKCRH